MTSHLRCVAGALRRGGLYLLGLHLTPTTVAPSETESWSARRGNLSATTFLCTTGRDLRRRREVYPASDLGIYIQSTVQGTSYHCEFNLFYDPESQAEVTRIKGLSSTAVKNLMNKGAFFSRPYGDNIGAIMNRDSATLDVVNKLKNIFDPNNVMNPGKVF